jgi:hypothetical protein
MRQFLAPSISLNDFGELIPVPRVRNELRIAALTSLLSILHENVPPIERVPFMVYLLTPVFSSLSDITGIESIESNFIGDLGAQFSTVRRAIVNLAANHTIDTELHRLFLKALAHPLAFTVGSDDLYVSFLILLQCVQVVPKGGIRNQIWKMLAFWVIRTSSLELTDCLIEVAISADVETQCQASDPESSES